SLLSPQAAIQKGQRTHAPRPRVSRAGHPHANQNRERAKVGKGFDSRKPDRTRLQFWTPMEEPSSDAKGKAKKRDVVRAILEPYMDEQDVGFFRIGHLLQVAERLSLPEVRSVVNDPGKEDAAQDVLRAAVVLIHAHLEEFLRLITRELANDAGEEYLNQVPLAGVNGRPEKFYLSSLARHRGKLVDDLIKESVSQYLERSTFNSTDEISVLLKRLGLNVEEHNEEFEWIQQMIE